MLTINSIIKTTRQMTAYGEYGTSEAARQRCHAEYVSKPNIEPVSSPHRKPARAWDEDKKVFVHT